MRPEHGSSVGATGLSPLSLFVSSLSHCCLQSDSHTSSEFVAVFLPRPPVVSPLSLLLCSCCQEMCLRHREQELKDEDKEYDCLSGPKIFPVFSVHIQKHALCQGRSQTSCSFFYCQLN